VDSPPALLSEVLYEDIREVLLRLTPEQVRYAFARLTTTTDKEAMIKAGIAEQSTITKWKKTVPDVTLAIRLLMLKPLESALARLEQGALRAAEVLVELLDHQHPKIQLQAANSIFKHLGVGSTKYLEIRGQVKVQPDVPDDELMQRAWQVMERQGRLLTDVVEGEIADDSSNVA
jgi:hypothetical protein